jgi:hypothetical protein
MMYRYLKICVFYLKHIVMHNGKITANSAGEGLGCSFTVEIDMQRKVLSPLSGVSLNQVNASL